MEKRKLNWSERSLDGAEDPGAGRAAGADSSWNAKAHCLENYLNRLIFAPAVSLVCSK